MNETMVATIEGDAAVAEGRRVWRDLGEDLLILLVLVAVLAYVVTVGEVWRIRDWRRPPVVTVAPTISNQAAVVWLDESAGRR